LARNNINVSRQSPDSPITQPQQPPQTPSSPENESPQQDNKDKTKKDLPNNIDIDNIDIDNIDIDNIDIDEVKKIVLSKLNLLIKNKETSELCFKQLCKGEENWENYLNSISDKKEVITFGKEMEKIIEGLEDKKQRNSTKGQPEQNF
jgi:hypothetical protein